MVAYFLEELYVMKTRHLHQDRNDSRFPTLKQQKSFPRSSHLPHQKPPTSQVTTNTTTTATSTITQESLEEALQRFRQETNETIASFKNNIRTEITSHRRQDHNSYVKRPLQRPERDHYSERN
jgi:hypothetical protein